MDQSDLVAFLRQYPLAVQASAAVGGGVQAAVVGIAVSDELEVVFDTVESSRKVANLRRDPRIALVIAGTIIGDERTVQYEGLADEPTGDDLARLQELYFAVFPDGRERAGRPGITYLRARPSWIRYIDFGADPPTSVEFGPDELRR